MGFPWQRETVAVRRTQIVWGLTDGSFTYVGGTKKWKLNTAFQFLSVHVGRITVPRGYRSDLHSIPRVFRPFFDPANYPEAALAHDYLLDRRQLAREVCDRVWKEMMLHCGAGKKRTQVMYLGLAAFTKAQNVYRWGRSLITRG